MFGGKGENMPMFGDYELSDLAISDLTTVLRVWRDKGPSRIEKEMRGFVADHDCGAFFHVDDPRQFGWRVEVLNRWISTAEYQAMRRFQLLDGKFSLWVYKIGNICPIHQEWDGFVAAADHPIWITHFPANGWHCTCRVRGAHSARGVARAKGNLEKPLPLGWDTLDPSTGLPPGIEPGFGTHVFPGMHACLHAISDGIHDLAPYYQPENQL